MAAVSSFAGLAALAEIAPAYRALRTTHPAVPASSVLAFLRHGEGGSLDQFLCRHEWAYTGSAYGGDDERWHGEGRCYCIHCGADGDA